MKNSKKKNIQTNLKKQKTKKNSPIDYYSGIFIKKTKTTTKNGSLMLKMPFFGDILSNCNSTIKKIVGNMRLVNPFISR